jgi:hypothetical protein
MGLQVSCGLGFANDPPTPIVTFRRKIPEAGETALRRRIQGGLKNN